MHRQGSTPVAWQSSRKTRKIGGDAKALLGPARAQPKPRHHFVEDEQRSICRRDLAQEFQIARLRQVKSGVARYGFENDSSDLPGIRGEGRLDQLGIIE